MEELDRFRAAVDAIGAGDVARLESLLDAHPWLSGYQCRTGELYESGYFAGATLLHHIAGNPVEALTGRMPSNIVEVARVLIGRGFERNSAEYAIELLLTSKQASQSGVALPLIDLLVAAGARFNLEDPELLSKPLLNVAPETAEALIRRGARIDVRHAAALGLGDMLRDLLGKDASQPLLEEALAFACIRGQGESVAVLIEHGARGDALVTPGGQTPRTALHEAANRGYAEIVKMLLANGADASVIEPRWKGTPAGWAEHGGHPELAALFASSS